jgi:hypothetical protein
MTEDFSTLDLLSRVLRYWKLVILMMIVGGLAGYVDHLAQPQLYQSESAISFAFNVTRFGNLSQFDQDSAMGAVGFMIANSPVPEYVYEQAHARGISLDQYPVNRTVFVERKLDRWVVRVRNPDPQAAAFIANTWTGRAYQELLQAQVHAERANSLRIYLDSLTSCLERMAVTEPASSQCSLNSLAALQQQLQTTGVEYTNELQLSRGFMPYLIFNPPDQAVPASAPDQFGRNNLVLAGILIGFFLSIYVVAADLPRRIAQRIRHASPGKTNTSPHS